ncbi:HAD family hydrolase [Pelotalea chapellei]|uniref:HAD family phosphatase n=1 Tax=Pelotalea chapellei TaxID=44671 RepID=A0ABS5UBJ8_9BACT|nr:HAD family phosphatase [Pelotalea chapellei]MBT1073026.1 HAD family phosphatase [Pelotalea chapellei]
MVNLSGIQTEAVIFDFDGVIVDTEPLHYKAFQQILEPLGLGFSWEKYVETYMGFDDRDAFVEAFTSRGMPLNHEKLTALIAQKAMFFLEIIRTGITAYPGVVELIKELKKKNVPLAICSGALLSDITPILSTLGISDCFDIIVTADDVEKSKPDPECYKLAFSKLSHHTDAAITLSNTFAIEDTPAGITAASRAGLKVIAVTNSYSPEHLTDASHIFNSLEKLLPA